MGVFQKTYLRSHLTARVSRKLNWKLVDILPHIEVNPTKLLKYTGNSKWVYLGANR